MNFLYFITILLHLIIRFGCINDLTGLKNTPLMPLDVQRATKQNRQNTENLKINFQFNSLFRFLQ